MKTYFWLTFTCKGICKNMHLGYAKVSNKHKVNVFSVECSLFFLWKSPFYLYCIG